MSRPCLSDHIRSTAWAVVSHPPRFFTGSTAGLTVLCASGARETANFRILHEGWRIAAARSCSTSTERQENTAIFLQARSRFAVSTVSLISHRCRRCLIEHGERGCITEQSQDDPIGYDSLLGNEIEIDLTCCTGSGGAVRLREASALPGPSRRALFKSSSSA